MEAPGQRRTRGAGRRDGELGAYSNPDGERGAGRNSREVETQRIDIRALSSTHLIFFISALLVIGVWCVWCTVSRSRIFAWEAGCPKLKSPLDSLFGGFGGKCASFFELRRTSDHEDLSCTQHPGTPFWSFLFWDRLSHTPLPHSSCITIHI